MVSDIFQVILLLFSFFIALKYSLVQEIDKKFVYFFIAFFSLHLIHGIRGGNFDIVLAGGFLMRLLIAYFFILIVNHDFPKIYVKLIYIFSVISVFFYIPLLFYPPFADLLFDFYHTYISKVEFKETLNYHVFIYVFDTYIYYDIPRNASVFWEPGAFGLFLNIGILLNIVIKGNLFNKSNIFFMLMILTTQSTGSYLSLFTIIISYYLVKEDIRFKYGILAFFLIIGSYLYTSLEFMEEKIEDQIGYFKENPKPGFNQERMTRLQSAAQEFNIFLEYPLFGRGSFERYDVERDVITVTSILKHFGLVGFVLIITFLFSSMKHFCKINSYNQNFAIFISISLLVITISQSM